MKLPWKLIVTCILISVVLRPLFRDDAEYIVVALISGAVLGWAEHKFKLGLMK